MNRTNSNDKNTIMKSSVNTNELQQMLSCGRSTAVQIGNNACAKIQIGRRVLWNVSKINEYLNAISE